MPHVYTPCFTAINLIRSRLRKSCFESCTFNLQNHPLTRILTGQSVMWPAQSFISSQSIVRKVSEMPMPMRTSRWNSRIIHITGYSVMIDGKQDPTQDYKQNLLLTYTSQCHLKDEVVFTRLLHMYTSNPPSSTLK